MTKQEAERKLAAILAADMVAFSRMMEADEDGTLARQRSIRTDVIDPIFGQHKGRIFKTTGDRLLAEFASAAEAVTCAVDMQQALAEREAKAPDEHRIQYRIGINLGDIVVDEDGDVFGDGVNVAARIEALAQAGGVAISDVVYQSVAGKLDLAFDDDGAHEVKNLTKPVHIWQWRSEVEDAAVRQGLQEQVVRFCTASDGTEIAYATVGQGPPLFRAPHWMNHLEFDWESPVWRHLLRDLSAQHTLVRFDQRANGLSDWDVADISFDAMLSDMEAVADAAGLERFPILGISQGCSYSIAYAARHPERVSRLVLYGGFAAGALMTGSESDRQRRQMTAQMMAQGWGQDNPAFRQFFTTLFMPRATKEQMDWFNELQRTTVSPENASRLHMVSGNIDVRDLLPQISVPTLVLHCRDDGIVPFDKGRKIAAGIPGARFVALDGQNHLILEDEPAWPRFIDEVLRFLAEDETDG